MSVEKYELLEVGGLPENELWEGANHFAGLARATAKTTLMQACQSGAMLNKLKEQVPHGLWLGTLKAEFDYSAQTASTYMHLAANFKRLKFEEVKSIRDAVAYLELLDKPEPAPEVIPRSERKTGQVKVSKSDETAVPPGQPSVQPDPDPNPAPKTNTKHSPATAKASEAKRTPPPVVTPEIVDEPAAEAPDVRVKFALREINQVAPLLPEKEHKPTAKELRKVADKLDPPTKFVRPDGNDVAATMLVYASSQEFIAKYGRRTEQQVNAAAEEFFDHYSGNGWMVGKVKMQDWKATARKWLRNQDSFSAGNGKAASNVPSTTQRREAANASAFDHIRRAAAERASGGG